MFDCTRYVPILRWKRAERDALRFLTEDVRASLTPLIEVTPKSFAARDDGSTPTVSEALSKVAHELLSHWGWRPAFIDLMHLSDDLRTEDDRPALVYLSSEARRRGAPVIPVTDLGRSRVFQEAVKLVSAGGSPRVCIRLFQRDLARPTLETDVGALLTNLGVERAQTDLVVDAQFIGDTIPDWNRALRKVPTLEEWRTITLAAGAFPVDLAKFSVGIHPVRRADWLGWVQLIRTQGALERQSMFSDYTIQHGLYREPPERANVSASIRYTSQESWIVMRGKALRTDNGPGNKQYHAEAKVLCGRQEFSGKSFSYGDAYIHERSVLRAPTGSAETLLRAGFNHHMTLVVRQLANLFGT